MEILSVATDWDKLRMQVEAGELEFIATGADSAVFFTGDKVIQYYINAFEYFDKVDQTIVDTINMYLQIKHDLGQFEFLEKSKFEFNDKEIEYSVRCPKVYGYSCEQGKVPIACVEYINGYRFSEICRGFIEGGYIDEETINYLNLSGENLLPFCNILKEIVEKSIGCIYTNYSIKPSSKLGAVNLIFRVQNNNMELCITDFANNIADLKRIGN